MNNYFKWGKLFETTIMSNPVILPNGESYHFFYTFTNITIDGEIIWVKQPPKIGVSRVYACQVIINDKGDGIVKVRSMDKTLSIQVDDVSLYKNNNNSNSTSILFFGSES